MCFKTISPHSPHPPLRPLLTLDLFLLWHLYIEDFQHILKSYIKAFVLCFSHMPFLMDYCSRVARTGGDTLFWVLMLLFSAGVSVSGFGMIMTVGFDIYSCLYWDGVPFLDFCCPLWISAMCSDCSECFWVLARCVHWKFQVKCVSRYWELTEMNGDGIDGGIQGVHHKIWLSPQGLELG